jgi:transposase
MDEKTVRKWLRRFREQGLAGLVDAPRSGAPSRSTPEIKARIIATALTHPRDLGQSFSRWTCARLATYVREELGIGMKQTCIFEILQQEGARWRHEEIWFGERVDPEIGGPRAPPQRTASPQRHPRYR